VEDVKLVLLKNNGFKPATILRRRIFTWMNYEIGGFIQVDSSRARYHMIPGFKLFVRCRLVAVW
jgi:hypothetical protein